MRGQNINVTHDSTNTTRINTESAASVARPAAFPIDACSADDGGGVKLRPSVLQKERVSTSFGQSVRMLAKLATHCAEPSDWPLRGTREKRKKRATTRAPPEAVSVVVVSTKRMIFPSHAVSVSGRGQQSRACGRKTQKNVN